MGNYNAKLYMISKAESKMGQFKYGQRNHGDQMERYDEFLLLETVTHKMVAVTPEWFNEKRY